MTGSQPTPSFGFSHPAHVIALGFGAGLAPVAPGTFGTLLAWPFGWVAAGSMTPTIALVLVVVLFSVGVWACTVTGRHLGAHDHGAMVWDEFVAFLAVLILVPRTAAWQIAAFVLFRAFDILKPPPIRWIERRFRAGFGVMIDDMLAAGYTLLVLAVAKRILG